tara:strand:+ start:3923 stop:4087 length:165 start_codon:yes stop_codon:yes gene_type:complete
MSKPKNCSICYEPIKGFGNNAEPINSGICCDACNYAAVLPKRLSLLFSSKSKSK